MRRNYVGGAANDLGFIKNTDGTYSSMISQFDRGRHNQKWLDGLKRSYTEKVTHKEAKRLDLKLLSNKVVNGKRVIQYLSA